MNLIDPLYKHLATPWAILMLSPSLLVRDIDAPFNNPPCAKAQTVRIPTLPGQSRSGPVLASAFNAGSSDPDGEPVTFQVHPSGPYPYGKMPVRLQVIDARGMSNGVDTMVEVYDPEPPVFTQDPLPAVTLTTDAGLATASASRLGRPAATDNVGVRSVRVAEDTQILAIGPQTVTWVATDLDGNTTTRTQVVTVVDGEAPRVAAPLPIIRYLAEGAASMAAADLGTPVATDNVGVVSLVSDAPPGPWTPGRFTVTWTATDAAGHQGTAEQVVLIEASTTDPAVRLTSPGPDMTFPAGSTIHCTAWVDQVVADDVLEVQFWSNGLHLGSDATAPYGVDWTAIPVGTHPIEARMRLRSLGHRANPVEVISAPRTITVITLPAEISP
jgi:hypothetical protein